MDWGSQVKLAVLTQKCCLQPISMPLNTNVEVENDLNLGVGAFNAKNKLLITQRKRLSDRTGMAPTQSFLSVYPVIPDQCLHDLINYQCPRAI